MRQLLWPGMLLAALLVGALLRLPGLAAAYPYLNYVDEGHVLHPVVGSLRGMPWHPDMSAYPVLPGRTIGAATRLVALALDPFRAEPLLGGLPPFRVYDEVRPPEVLLVARVLSLLVSLGTILCIGLLGRRLAGDAGGAVAAFAAAMLPALLVRGTIVAVDGYAAFFVVAALLLVAGVERPDQLLRIAGAGVCSGCAVVSKYPSGLVGIAVVTVFAFAPWPWVARLRAAAIAGAAGAVAAGAIMPTLWREPMALWQRLQWIEGLYSTLKGDSYWHQAFVRGQADLPLPYPEVGAVFALWALAGVALLVVSPRWRRFGVALVVFAVLLMAFCSTYSWTPFRNLLSLAAVACVAAGYAAGRLAERLQRAGLVAGAAIAFLLVWFAPPARHFVAERRGLVDSRHQAAEWIAARRPTGRVLVQTTVAMARSDLARLGSRAREASWPQIERQALRRPPQFVVIGDLVRTTDLEPLIDPAQLRRLRHRYRVAATFGDHQSFSDSWTWRTNRLRVVVLERWSPERRRGGTGDPEPAGPAGEASPP